MIENPILPIIQQLAIWAVVFIPILTAFVEGLKKIFGLKDFAALITAIVTNLVMGILLVVAYVFPNSAQYIAYFVFLILMMVAPLGGYSLLKKFGTQPVE